MQRMASNAGTLHGRTGLEKVTRETPEISKYIDFGFDDPCWYKENAGMGETKMGRWLGVSHKTGSLMSFWVLTLSCHVVSRTSVQRITNLELQQETNKRRMTTFDDAVKEYLRDYNHVLNNGERIPSTTPGAEPPRDARDSGSARSHSTHLETSSSDGPKMVTYTEPLTVSSYMSVTCTRRTLRMPNFTRATHAQPSLSNFPWRDSDFGKRTRSRGTTLGEQNFPTSPQNKITKLTHCSIYVPMRTISTPQIK